MTRRIMLHVGTPKTGTSYLQDVLFNNRVDLARRGVLYPADRFDAHFLAALDLMQLPWGGLEREAVGAWDRLAREATSGHGIDQVIISHEILARAGRADVERALTSLGRDEGAEIHVVVSARDLTRQIPAEWQENVKHRAEVGYRRFLDDITDPQRPGRIASWFWGVQELPDILDRWAGGLPPERVHIVTVPPAGSPPGLLWQRFTETFGLDGVALDLHTERANPSLGVPETALIRRINAAFNADVPPADYRPLVRELLAHQTLSRRTGSARLAVPLDLQPWVAGVERSWIDELSARGYHVVGDLADLHGVPAPQAGAGSDPDDPDPAQVADAALDAIGALLGELKRQRHEIERLHGEVGATHRELERSYLRPTYRLRAKVVRRLQGSATGQRLLRGYRHLRRR